MSCVNCGKETPASLNYCDWDCHVDYAKKCGGKVYCPNGLPIGSIKWNGNMYEHEHGDHLTYMFPVEVEFVGAITDDHAKEAKSMFAHDMTDEQIRKSLRESHALIYTDGNVAITMHECCYAMWHVCRSGELLGDFMLWKKGDYRLSEESVEKIKEWLKKNLK